MSQLTVLFQKILKPTVCVYKQVTYLQVVHCPTFAAICLVRYGMSFQRNLALAGFDKSNLVQL